MVFKLHFCHSASLHFMAKMQLKNHRLSQRYVKIMLKELHSFSVIAALSAMTIMLIETLFAGIGFASLLFGSIVLPFAYLFAFVLGFPLLLAQKKIKLNIYVWLIIYNAAGLFGATTFLLGMGISMENVFSLASGFFLTYAPMGVTAATAAWYFSTYRKTKSGSQSVHT